MTDKTLFEPYTLGFHPMSSFPHQQDPAKAHRGQQHGLALQQNRPMKCRDRESNGSKIQL